MLLSCFTEVGRRHIHYRHHNIDTDLTISPSNSLLSTYVQSPILPAADKLQ